MSEGECDGQHQGRDEPKSRRSDDAPTLNELRRDRTFTDGSSLTLTSRESCSEENWTSPVLLADRMLPGPGCWRKSDRGSH